jgi:hypothetical protein
MNNYTLTPDSYQVIVVNQNTSEHVCEFGTVPPLLSASEIMLKSIKEINKTFSEMTDTLRNRKTALWPKSP